MNTYNECIDLIEDKKSLNYSELESKWEIFKKKYPKLYEMLTLTDQVDLKMLKFLCEKAYEQNLLTSTEEKLETDFEVGDRLAKTYIYDKFPEPSPQQTEFIKETLRKKINNGNLNGSGTESIPDGPTIEELP